ncbi:hypothetical protein GS429_18845 [Natronorubrum sp. JWXQ-INN-674]|uniref:Cox cluster protein n=1 Tax=Natronorubrum halalkaliphilum TaxID=2691917 RepID=A0A6B0VRW1_9EURY|nr:hypothetical protein [Natronorubrum halalkaliphilum]MXV64085.1 hypothetical protein [Natronorubrum halalkaliphilum]
MADHSSATDRERPTASPWPVLIALGLALSEVGIVVDLFPIAVAGLVLFAVSVTGILAESRHIANPQSLATGFGLAFVLLGSVLYVLGTGSLSVAAADDLTGLASRGLAIAVAGVVTIAGTAIKRYRQG